MPDGERGERRARKRKVCAFGGVSGKSAGYMTEMTRNRRGWETQRGSTARALNRWQTLAHGKAVSAGRR